MRNGAILALLLCFRAFGQDTLLEGVTVDSSTGRPIAGVHVRVFSLGMNNRAPVFGAMSDSAGHFSIARIPPGSYFCMGERAGYLTVGKGGGIPFPPVILKAGERVPDFKLELTPRATVGGRVLDEYGDPVQSVQVQMTPVSPEAPVAVAMMGSATQTDDRGEFRLAAGPGKYRVRATVFRQPGRSTEIRTDGTAPAEYAPTEYPAMVEVAAGAEVHGIEIHLGRRAAESGVEAMVSGIPDSRGWANVHLVSRDAESGLNYSQATQTSGEGRFSFHDVRPGSYRMFASYTLDGKALVSQTVEFTGAALPAGIVLRLGPAPEVSGSIVFDGGNPAEDKRTVALQPTGSSLPTAKGEIDASQGFRVAGVFPGRYRVVVQPLPENAYVRAIEVDGTAVVPEELELLGATRMKVTIGRNAAQITGHVLDPDGARVQSGLGGVVLLRDLKKVELTTEENVSRFGPDGSYSFKGLRPGRYWLLALDALRTRGLNSVEQVKGYTPLAEAVEVKEGDRVRKDLTVATKEALDAKAK